MVPISGLAYGLLDSKSNLTRYTTPHLTPLTLLATFDEHLTFSDEISAISNACYYHIRQLRGIRPDFDSTQRAPLPPPLFTPNLITAILSTTPIPKSQITRLQLIQNSLARASLKLLNPVTSLLSCLTLFNLHWLKINNRTDRIQTPFTHLQSHHNHPTSISPPPHLCSTSSQHSLFISGYPRSTTNIILATYN